MNFKDYMKRQEHNKNASSGKPHINKDILNKVDDDTKENIQKNYDHYANYSETELKNELKTMLKNKNSGTADMKNMYDTLSPFLDDSGKNKLKNIIKELDE